MDYGNMFSRLRQFGGMQRPGMGMPQRPVAGQWGGFAQGLGQQIRGVAQQPFMQRGGGMFPGGQMPNAQPMPNPSVLPQANGQMSIQSPQNAGMGGGISSIFNRLNNGGGNVY